MSDLQASDLSALREEHKFVRDEEEDEARLGDWKVRMARRYYDRLYKEFAVIDLSRYEQGAIGLRWRTEDEVLQGKGQLLCATRRCVSREALTSFELPFAYVEQGEEKLELVKVCLCKACAEKLEIYQMIQRKGKRDASSTKDGAESVSSSSSSSSTPSRGKKERREDRDHKKSKKKKRKAN